MANQDREERQAMRQRGPGLRNLDNPDFDLDFPTTAGSREERLLMRQRGAGNREINNIDFGFAFATPKMVPARRSRTRSKTPATLVRPPLKENGENRQLPVMPLQSAKPTEQRLLSSGRVRDGSILHTGRKRRRLSEVSNITQATSLDIPLASERSDVNALEPNTPYQEPESLNNIHDSARQSSRFEIPSSPLFLPDHNDEDNDMDKENSPPAMEPVKPVSKKRKRKSIGQQSRSKRKRSSGASNASILAAIETEVVQDQDENREEQLEPSLVKETGDTPRSTLQQQRATSPPGTQSHNNQESTVSTQPKRRKKRKSIAQGKTRRRSATVPASSADIPKVVRSIEVRPADDHVDLMDHEASPGIAQSNERNDLAGKSVPTTRRARKSYEEAREFDVRDEEEADETYLPDEATPEPTPAPKRAREKQNTKRRSRSNGSVPSTTTARSRSDEFPILTHRMTNAHTLPTIIEESEPQEHLNNDGNSSADELALIPPPTIVTRTTPNAVDVLAQACRETIDASIQKLKESLPAGRVRADNVRQIDALRTFGANLETRLFDLSQSLDQRLHMEARLRKSRREKNELQARWLEVRKQRDLMALRKDNIRRQHWEAEGLSRKAWDVSQAAHRLDTVVDKVIDEDDENERSRSQADLLQFSLREVGHDVSSKDGGGILNVLKRFNAQLERAVNAPD